ncbi:MAG: ABC transporter permease [Mesorhizobium sp.]|nr:MAG: ABC transporter permease [Mesorhizobium sp.]
MARLARLTGVLPDWIVTSFWLLALVAIWSTAVWMLKIPDYILPSPEQVLGLIGSKLTYFGAHTASTLEVVALGFASGAAAAIPAGLALAKIRWMERALYPFIVFLQTMPLISLVPVLIIWLGYGLATSSVLVGFSVFFPVLVNAVTGVRSTPDRLYFVTRTMGASALQTFWYIDWPTMLPYLISAFRISLALATTTAVVSEFLASNDGLGYAALVGARNRDTVQVIAVVLITAAVGVALNTISFLVDKKITRKYRG